MADERTRAGFYFVGERVCLDFVNTEAAEQGTAVDLLASFDDLVAWSAAAPLIDAPHAKRLRQDWSGTRDGDRALAEAKQFRATLRALAERVAAGRRAPRAALDAINDVLRTRAGHMELVETKDGYAQRFHADFTDPAQLLVPIAESAADLLSEGDPALVRKCHNPLCILYFYDTTKNHARRWCSMTACGNRAKVAAHYRRTRDSLE